MPRKTRRIQFPAFDLWLASMRPRPDAAENIRCTAFNRWNRARFNEAAARCRGKLEVRMRRSQPIGIASMRPRPDAAEN